MSSAVPPTPSPIAAATLDGAISAISAHPTPANALAAPSSPQVSDVNLVDLLQQRKQRAAESEARRAATLAAAAAGGAARSGAVLGLICDKLPPELRAKVLAFHPQAAAMPATICRTPKELFDDFIAAETPRIRRLPMAIAPRDSTANVALLIEPRPHYALEHVVRNAMLFLNGCEGTMAQWQLQIFHGTANLEHIRSSFTPTELENIEFISLEVDNLSNLAHNELMCTHWLWSRAAAERVLIFQTDSLVCRPDIERFQTWDYIGAPWAADDLWCVGKPWLTAVGGNGGFSLRSRSKTLECIDVHGYLRGQCEDVT